jgi:hypothetical protein
VLVAHTGNSTYAGAEFRRITVQRQPEQIVLQTLSQKKKKFNHKKREEMLVE